MTCSPPIFCNCPGSPSSCSLLYFSCSFSDKFPSQLQTHIAHRSQNKTKDEINQSTNPEQVFEPNATFIETTPNISGTNTLRTTCVTRGSKRNRTVVACFMSRLVQGMATTQNTAVNANRKSHTNRFGAGCVRSPVAAAAFFVAFAATRVAWAS